MKRKFFLSLIGALALCFFVSLAFAGNLDYAKSLYEQEKYEKALPELEDVFQSSKGNNRIDAMLHILRCYQFTRDYGSLASFYNENREMADDTEFEPEIDFVFANYLKDHVKDYTAARNLYKSIYQNFPNATFAGPGSLLKLGDIDVIEGKSNNALSRFDELIAKYPKCHYVDNALTGKVKAYIKLKDRENIIKTAEDLRKQFPSNLSTANAGIETGIYFYSIERNRRESVRQFKKVSDAFPDKFAGLFAKLRMADLVPGSRIKNSISLYKTVLQNAQKMRGSQKHWAQTELGVALYLKKDFDEAAIELQKVIDSGAPEKYKKRAQLHLDAIDDPQSLSAAFVNIDAAVRYRRDLHAFDTAYWSFRVYTDAWKAGKFESFLEDPNIPDEEKAKREYQLSLAYYNISYLHKSDTQAKKVVEKYPHVDYYCASAKYSLAHHKELGGKFLDAIDGYMDILEQYPDIEFAPKVMTKIGDCFLQMDRQAEAVYVYDCIANLYPHRLEGLGAVQAVDFVLRGRPDIKEAFQVAKATGGSNLAMKKLPPSYAMKLPPLLERLDRMKEKLILAMAKDKGESIKDFVTDIK